LGIGKVASSEFVYWQLYDNIYRHTFYLLLIIPYSLLPLKSKTPTSRKTRLEIGELQTILFYLLGCLIAKLTSKLKFLSYYFGQIDYFQAFL